MPRTKQFYALIVSLSAILFFASPALAADAPAPSGAEKVSEQPRRGGTHTLYRSSKSATEIVQAYQTTLESDGWTIQSSGSGGGSYGGGGGLTASKDSQYLVMTAGGQAGATNIDLCVWPSKPSNDDC
ncbi:hypothetical protein [Hoeflea poritis]|uniref:Uncharacterized protein n=1 Tax=Hoeflea poritis TaxID=2993659 RepID=A0ABT4VQM2_9HYPH|nr:hypothetical protein [Hoeflea poritis]MDA4847008.1 hypothetical protein [Hoeflea poritis]